MFPLGLAPYDQVMKSLLLAPFFLCVAAAAAVPLTGDISIRTTNQLTTANVKPGDSWVGHVAHDLTRDGEVVVKRGTPVTGIVVDVSTPKDKTPRASLSIKLLAVGADTVDTNAHRAEGGLAGSRPVAKVTGWGAAGAFLGSLLGGGKGALIGAGAGAGLGGLRSRSREKGDAVIPAETLLTFRIKDGATIQ